MVKIFIPLVQYAVLLEVDELPKTGDVITITRQNLLEWGRAIDNSIYGHKVTIHKRVDDTGWANRSETYPSYDASIS